MTRIFLAALSAVCAFVVLIGIDTGDLGDLKVLALGLLLAAFALIVP